MWVTTLTTFEHKIIDSLKRTHPLLDKIAGKDNFEGKEGNKGKRVVEMILARSNDAVRFAPLDGMITPNTPRLLERIEWDWKFMYNSFVLSEKMLSIQSSSPIANLVSLQKEAMQRGFAKRLAKQLFRHGANKYEMGGLKYLLSDNPYADPASGQGLWVLNLRRDGVPGDSREFWRNRVGAWTTTPGLENSIPTYDDAGALRFVKTLDNVLDVLDNGEDKIDGIYMNYYFYGLYAFYMRSLLHVNNVSSEKTDAGFQHFTHRGVPLFLDKYCPNDRIYFINSDYFHFNYLQGENFSTDVKDVPFMQAKQYITTFMGNFTIAKPRSHAVITTYEGATDPLPDTVNICKFSSYVDYDYVDELEADGSGGDMGTGGIEHEDYSGSGVYVRDFMSAVAGMQKEHGNMTNAEKATKKGSIPQGTDPKKNK
jgi:hypothetical protein